MSSVPTMSREQAIELLKQFKLAEIIAAVQAAYKQGYTAAQVEARRFADLDDDIPF